MSPFDAKLFPAVILISSFRVGLKLKLYKERMFLSGNGLGKIMYLSIPGMTFQAIWPQLQNSVPAEKHFRYLNLRNVLKYSIIAILIFVFCFFVILILINTIFQYINHSYKLFQKSEKPSSKIAIILGFIFIFSVSFRCRCWILNK